MPDGPRSMTVQFTAVLAKVAYGLRDNIELGANYIASEQLSGASLDDDVFQVDMTFKF